MTLHLPKVNLQSFQVAQPDVLKHYIVEEYRHFHNSVSPLNQAIQTEDMYQAMYKYACPKWSFYYVNDSKIMYFITEKIDDTTAFVSYLGGNAPHNELLNFYKQCLQALLSSGVSVVSYELDDINDKQMLFAQLVTLPTISYDTYIYEK